MKNKKETLISLSDLAIQVKDQDAKVIPLSDNKESTLKKSKNKTSKNKENE